VTFLPDLRQVKRMRIARYQLQHLRWPLKTDNVAGGMFDVFSFCYFPPYIALTTTSSTRVP